MGLSRKRKRELKRLKNSASDLWAEQRGVLDQAGKVARDAGRTARTLGREEVAPRVRDTVDHRIRPAVHSGVSATRHAADSARHTLTHNVLPSVASAVSSALAVVEVSKNMKVKEALKEVRKSGEKVNKKIGKEVQKALPKKKKSTGPGRYIMMTVGLVALAGVAYAAWQTLRDDEELWVSDEMEGLEPAEAL